MNVFSHIIQPVITEKSSNQQAQGQYTFLVPRKKTTKIDIKNAIKAIYGVEVKSVKIIILPKKTRNLGRRTIKKRPVLKKAIVTLKGKKTIDPNKIKDFKSK